MKKITGVSTEELAALSELLCEKSNELTQLCNRPRSDIFLPSKKTIIKITDLIRSVIFPGFYGVECVTVKSLPFYVASTIDNIHFELKEQIRRGFCFNAGDHELHCEECDEKAEIFSRKFISKIPDIQRTLFTDAQAAYDGDPAATSINECIYSYPGVFAVTNYRIANALYKLDVPIIPRIITEYAHNITGVDIHPGATIGNRFFIDHGTGVVIGETTIIGNNVRLYQGVTLGAKSFPLDEDGNPIKGIARHPILEDDVIVYAGATVLGRITIGKGAVVGGNSWITKDVEPGAQTR